MPRILVVDDNPAVRGLLHDALEDEGYMVLTATTGTAAFVMASEFQPDVILADVVLPEMDGITLCQRLHAHPRTAAIPVVLWSGRHEADIPPGTPYRAFVPKPFDLDGLFGTLQQIVAAP